MPSGHSIDAAFGVAGLSINQFANSAAFLEIEYIVGSDRALHVNPERNAVWMLKRDTRQRLHDRLRAETARIADDVG